MSSIVIGIDLGTSNSCVSYVVNGKPVVIENKEGNRTTPSIVFTNPKDDSVIVGDVAKRNMVLYPKDVIHQAKRFIGRSFADKEVQTDISRMGYEIIEEGGKIKIKNSKGKKYSPEEISAAILRKIKTDSEAKLGQSISEAVITVPAYFDDAQRQATKDAGEIAGLKVLRIINEPTAAALAYGFEKGQDEKVLVYDLGGGTFDVTVLEISNETIEVLATNGDTHLGGTDFDAALVNYIIGEFKKESGIDLDKDKAAKQRVRESAEKCKHDLSTQNEHQINLPFITVDTENQPQHLLLSITRTKFEELVKGLVERSMEPVKKALADSKLDKNQIQEIIMVGGMTRMPMVQKAVEDYFGKKPNLSVNPDEVVAMGAAIQGAVLKGDVKDILLLDVTPLTLAIETAGGVATPMIPRNTTIPTSKSQIFSTYADNQTAVDVHVVQGERPLASDNKSLGKFTLSGIAPAPRGVPQIEVTFDLDANGILTVTAVDKGTGKNAKISITGSSTLSEEEKQKAIEEADRQKDNDLAKKAKIDAKNQADALIFQAEKLVKDMGDKLANEDKVEIESKKEELEKLLKDESSSRETLETGSKNLQESLMKVGEKVYSSGGGEPAETGADSNVSEPKTDTNDKPKPTDIPVEPIVK